MKRKFETQTGRLSKYTQPDKERYQQILAERNRRALELGATPNKRKKRNAQGEGCGYDSIKEQIQDNVVVDPVSGCWIWLKPLQNVGYGLVEIPRTAADGPGPIQKRDGLRKPTKTRTVHRVSYEEFVGPIPKGRIIAHTCDTTFCCNPEHLWVGTRKQNIQDAILKGRFVVNYGGGDRSSGTWKEPIQCPHCKAEGTSLHIHRWHFDRCKFRPGAPVVPARVYKLSEQARKNQSIGQQKYLAARREAKKAALVLIAQVQANTATSET